MATQTSVEPFVLRLAIGALPRRTYGPVPVSRWFMPPVLEATDPGEVEASGTAQKMLMLN
jgi:hypothetical protein